MLYTDPESARTINRLRILNRLFREPCSRADLSRHLNLNKMTVSAVISSLLEENLIRESGKTSGSTGRRATTLEINGTAFTFIAADVGLYKTRIALSDACGQLTGLEEFFTPPDRSVGFFLEFLQKKVQELRDKSGKKSTIRGISLALNGLIDPEAGTVRRSPNWDWTDVKIREMITARTGLPAVIDNNVRTMLKGERLFEDLKKDSTVFYVNWAEGIGSALMTSRMILPLHSEFGHLHVARTGLCSCGKIGCLEYHAGGKNLNERGNALLGASGKTTEELIGESQSHAGLRELFRYAASCMGKGLSSVANIISPDKIIIGGGLSDIGSYFLDVVKTEFNAHTMEQIKNNVTISTSPLGDQAGIRGAAALGLDEFIYRYSTLDTLKSN